MMFTRSVFLLLVAILGLSHAQNCSETESLFQIDFRITQEEFTSFSWNLEFASNRVYQDGTIRYGSYTSYAQVPSNETQCIPKSECIVLEVEDLRPEQYNISVDGEPITPGPSFPNYSVNSTFSTTEIGDCVPTCKEGEALFELAAFTGTKEYSGLDWTLEDTTDGEALAECDRGGFGVRCIYMPRNLYHSRQCLPVEGCYRLIVGDQYWSHYTEERGRSSFDVTFDDELITNLQDVRFDTVDFGGGCSATCKEDESLLEFFLWRFVFYDTYPDLSWSFRDGEDVLLDGTIAWNDTMLQYMRECVPSDACLAFAMSVPEMKTILKNEGTTIERNVTYFESDLYRLSLDGVVFVDSDYEFGGFNEDSREFSTTTAVGKCETSDLCDLESESLFELELETSGDSALYITWFVDFLDEEVTQTRGDYVTYSWEISHGLIPDNSYHTYRCIPKTDCMEFTIRGYSIRDGEEFSYTVSVDGNIVEKRDCGDSSCTDVGDLVTRLGGASCPRSSDLSAGAIAGIVVGSVVGLALAALIGHQLFRNRKPAATTPIASKESSETDANEDKAGKKEDADENDMEEIAV